MVACAPIQSPTDPEAELDALVRAAELDAVARLRKLVNSDDDAIAARAAAALLRYAGERRRTAARIAGAARRTKVRQDLAEVDRLARTLRPTRDAVPSDAAAPCDALKHGATAVVPLG